MKQHVKSQNNVLLQWFILNLKLNNAHRKNQM